MPETASPRASRTVPELRFDLTEAANRLAGVVVTERRPLPIEAANGALSGTVLIENLNGTYDGADLAYRCCASGSCSSVRTSSGVETFFE